MSSAGLDNWKRDYPPSERAIEILRRIVVEMKGDGARQIEDDCGPVCDAIKEAEVLLSEVDAK